MSINRVTLDDKYTANAGRAYMSGFQALVRLPMMQRRRDVAAGLNTAGYVSGYPGSPISGLDFQMMRAEKFLADDHVRFHAALNEDLAATAIWGTQQTGLFEGAKYDGVFALWFGKGPGVDRSGDVFVHANTAGTAPHGGVLVVAGDDHAARTTTTPHQSEPIFASHQMPILNPAGTQDFLDLGLHGWALSRYCGLWVGFTSVCDNIESSGSLHLDPHRITVRTPKDFKLPPGGLGIRWPDPPLPREAMMKEQQLFAALAYARANGLDETVIEAPKARLGIVTTGKAYLDTREALRLLGLDDKAAAKIGLRLYRVAMTWPLEPQGIARFAKGLEEILVVEEKRPFVETQIKEQLYNLPQSRRPRVVGKYPGHGEWVGAKRDWLLPSTGEFTPVMIARAVAARLAQFGANPRIERGLAELEARDKAIAAARRIKVETGTDAIFSSGRLPYYCSGCPHNTSTRVPEGSRALAGIGCHFMAQWMDRRTTNYCQMGGEGVVWVGQSPFTNAKHIFANLGDGTYLHSGLTAIRAAVAADITITYKILLNGAVAMTGGQPLPRELTAPQVSRQLAEEGVKTIVVVTDEPDKYPIGAGFAPGVAIRPRHEFESVQREMRELTGVTALIYDQGCAAEKRRARKRGKLADQPKRVFINDAVCEGCGDCSEVSNCLSVMPLETPFGRKRRIDQSSCNGDLSCLEGFCPALVTVIGGTPRKPKPDPAWAKSLGLPSDPKLPALPGDGAPYGVLVTGIGGTGVMTAGALIGMAAHLDGHAASVLDMTGLAQKGGAATTHVRIAHRPEDIDAARIPSFANAVVGCDIAVACEPEAMDRVKPGVTRAAVSTSRAAAGEFTADPDLKFPIAALQSKLTRVLGEDSVGFVDANRMATALVGDAIVTNAFMLGYAYQRGLIPVTGAAFVRAIELNGVAVADSTAAFAWGRRAAHRPDEVAALVGPEAGDPASEPLDARIARRAAYLRAYRNAAYASRYTDLVGRVRDKDAALSGNSAELSEAAARNHFKLLAMKDEYEVARLHAAPDFRAKLDDAFEGDFKVHFHLAPAFLARPDPASGRIAKRRFGPWIMVVFRVLARLKGLRGTILDPFARTHDRKVERRLLADYEARIADILARVEASNYQTAVALASLPDTIRGFGPVKDAAIERARTSETALLGEFGTPPVRAAAE